VSETPADYNGHGKGVLALGILAVLAAVLRYFMRGWLEPLGVPTVIGSFVASVTLVLLAGLLVLYRREGRRLGGRYWRATAWYVALAAWCELLVIAGILVTEQTGASTYYTGPWHMVEEVFPTATAHAIGHTQGWGLRLVIGLVLGAGVYLVARSGRERRAP
jgi:divalent metal cation (Fe/Co/Zn/Cd) transporter